MMLVSGLLVLRLSRQFFTMSESIWWPDDMWWERKVLPLGFITLSFRQLITITLAFLAAFAVSLPFQFPIGGMRLGGRAAVFVMLFGVGWTIATRRVKLLPVEVQAFYVIRQVTLKTVQVRILRVLQYLRYHVNAIRKLRIEIKLGRK